MPPCAAAVHVIVVPGAIGDDAFEVSDTIDASERPIVNGPSEPQVS